MHFILIAFNRVREKLCVLPRILFLFLSLSLFLQTFEGDFMGLRYLIQVFLVYDSIKEACAGYVFGFLCRIQGGGFYQG